MSSAIFVCWGAGWEANSLNTHLKNELSYVPGISRPYNINLCLCFLLGVRLEISHYLLP